MDNLDKQNPAGKGGASEPVQLGSANRPEFTKPESGKQLANLRQARADYLSAMAPGADPATLETRTRLLVARDTFMTRIGAWGEWPDHLQSIHVLAANEASHAAFSGLSSDDLDKHLEAARHLARATLILRDLGGECHAN